MQKMHPGSPMPFVVHLCTSHDISSTKIMHYRVGHTLNYILSKFEVNQTDSSCDTTIFVSYPLPGFPDLTIIKPSSI